MYAYEVEYVGTETNSHEIVPGFVALAEVGKWILNYAVALVHVVKEIWVNYHHNDDNFPKTLF